jgi:hypothetical protein
MSLDIALPYANSAKGTPAPPLLSDERAQLTQPYAGSLYHLAKQGKVFTGNSDAAGTVLPIFSATAQKFGLWNPSGSGVIGILHQVAMTYVSTTGAAGGYVLAINKTVGAQIATGGISVFTEGVPENSLGTTGGNKIKFAPATATTIAPTIWRHLGMNQLVTTAADATTVPWTMTQKFDGDCLVYPGTAVWLCGNIATLTQWASCFVWAEVPV